MKKLVAITIVFLLTSCGSPTTHFHRLAPVAPVAPVAPARAASPGKSACGPAATTPLMVDHILLPGVLDRQALVFAQGPDGLLVSGTNRWGGPLDEMIQRVLAENLRERLPPGRMLAPGDPAPPQGATRIAVNILQFMPDEAGQVVLRADWTLLGPKRQALMTRQESLPTAGGPEAQDAVAAMSRLLGMLADRVAADLCCRPACRAARDRPHVRPADAPPPGG